MNVKHKIKITKIIKLGVILSLVVILIHVVHAFTLDKIIEYKEVIFYSPDVASEMKGYRIAFVTDIHNLPAERLKEVVNKLNEKQIDLLVLGGDFPLESYAQLSSMEILSQVITTDGIYGIEGNHDDYRKLFAAMVEYSITPLSNNGVYIRDNFYLAGVEDLWNRTPSISEAIDGSLPEDFVLLVAHNPDISMLYNTTGVDLISSGHTHGGQITFFGIWAPYLTLRKSITSYGQRLMSGWSASRDGVPVYVSRGTGEYLPRVFARPQVILITLYNDKGRKG